MPSKLPWERVTARLEIFAQGSRKEVQVAGVLNFWFPWQLHDEDGFTLVRGFGKHPSHKALLSQEEFRRINDRQIATRTDIQRQIYARNILWSVDIASNPKYADSLYRVSLFDPYM